MTGGTAVAAAVATAGLLVVVRERGARPDLVRRGLGPSAPPPTRSWLDRQLDRWDDWIGAERQRNSLSLLAVPAGRHRRSQVAWVVAAVTVAAAYGWTRSGLPLAVFLAACGAPAGLLGAERWLHHRAARRRAVLAGQVLAVARTVALSVSAGETAAEAIARTATVALDPMRPWLVRVDAQIRSGRALAAALTEVADTLALPDFTMLVDTLLAASARGAPLASTLMAQVRDTSAKHRAAALERAGRADLAMLLPVVFLILPAVVVVALFPGVVALSSW